MKDLKISKELIKAVLEKETETLSKDFNFIINEDYIEFSDDGEMQFEYCIYKFAFKCKEWANKQNLFIVVYPIGKEFDFIIFDIKDTQFEKPLFQGYHKESIQQAVFDACERILKHKENQCTK